MALKAPDLTHKAPSRRAATSVTVTGNPRTVTGTISYRF